MLMKPQVPTEQLKSFGMMKFETHSHCNSFTPKEEKEEK